MSVVRRAPGRVLAALFGAVLAWASGAAGQVTPPERVVSLHESRLLHRAEDAVHRALLAETDEARDGSLEVAEQVARHLVDADSTSAEAHYWLAVALGIRTEFGGPLEKLTTGKEVFFTAARVLELDPDHAGGHEMMGRLHAAVMRLPWLVRTMALRMGMGDALGEASWAHAEEHFRRAATLDRAAVAPRLELAKLYVQHDRGDEARPVLRALARMEADGEVDRRLLAEGRALLDRLEAGDR